MSGDLPTTFAPLRSELLAAAAAFSSDAEPLAAILEGIVGDVERAAAEPLEIFPVAHHSPSSALHMLARLRRRAPRAIYLECCEDLRGEIELLKDCKLPVALQAFAGRSEAFPAAWSPLSVVCPISDFSAEQQVIAYCLGHPETELVFVDRSVDHVFQWLPQDDGALAERLPDDTQDDADEVAMHGTALGVEVGALTPTFDAFREHLVKNARVQHFSEWWDQYVEQPALAGSYAAYREVMFLIGSLFRRLGVRERDRAEDEQRERYMWTRIKEHLADNGIAPEDAIYVCGAAHSASRVEEFGVASGARWSIPPRTDTVWLYGVLPSSFAAIEHQFAHPRGFLSLAERRWKKAVDAGHLEPFRLDKAERKAKKATASPPAPADVGALSRFLREPPPPRAADDAELLSLCVGIVGQARKHGYLASTADSIAIYQTATLLARLRNRLEPSAYDFRDAAVTCLEKDRVPGKRDIGRLCDLLLGGDRVGTVGYESLPPLARDVYDRLAALPMQVEKKTVQRVLLDFDKNPEYRPAADLLWKLRYLLGGDDTVRPIMGERSLGAKARQESWDVAIGRRQGAVIRLGYEGVTVEHVLERRLKKRAFAADARCVAALGTVEDSILYLESDRLTEELGERAVALLTAEPDTRDAKAIYRLISRLLHHYRAARALPRFIADFVTTGYSHYCTLLPSAFADRGVSAEELTAMLEFVLTLESVALSLGCERSQFVIAIKQAGHAETDPVKRGLLWSTECVLGLRDFESLRRHFDELFENELAVAALPDYLAGFLLAITFTPLVAGFTVELLSKAFARLPDRLLMPWIPTVVMRFGQGLGPLATLIKEAGAILPNRLAALDGWQPPWEAPARAPVSTAPVSPAAAAANALLRRHPATIEALARSLGRDPTWQERQTLGSAPTLPSAAADARVTAARALLAAHPATLTALASASG
jgi:hypothetical protein